MVTHANSYCLGFAVWTFIETNEDTGIGNVQTLWGDIPVFNLYLVSKRQITTLFD